MLSEYLEICQEIMTSEEFDPESWWSSFVSTLLFHAKLQVVLPEEAYRPSILKCIIATRRELVEGIETDTPIDEWPQFTKIYDKLLHYAINLRMKIPTAIQYLEGGDTDRYVTYFQSVVSDLQSLLYLINRWKIATFSVVEDFYKSRMHHINSRHASLVRIRQNILNGYRQDLSLETVLAAIQQNMKERRSLLRKIQSQFAAYGLACQPLC